MIQQSGYKNMGFIGEAMNLEVKCSEFAEKPV